MIFDLHIIFHHRLNEREWNQFLEFYQYLLNKYNLESKGKIKGRLFDAILSEKKSKWFAFVLRYLFFKELKKHPSIDFLEYQVCDANESEINSKVDYNNEALFI